MFKLKPIPRTYKGKKASFQGWAKAGMRLTFRAEVMPGRETSQRTFTVSSVLANGRVELIGLAGEHSRTEFEATR